MYRNMSAREARELYSKVIDILNEKGKKAGIDFYAAEREISKKAAGELVAEMIATDPKRWKERGCLVIERTLIQVGYGIPQIEKEERESKKDQIRYEVARRKKDIVADKEDLVKSINWIVDDLQKLVVKLEKPGDPGFTYLDTELPMQRFQDLSKSITKIQQKASELELARTLIGLASDLAGEDITKCGRGVE